MIKFDGKKVSSSNKRWTEIEMSNLKSYIEHDYLLFDIKQYLLDRSGDAILAQARKMGYGEQKLKNGDKGFVFGVKYRGKNKVKPTETSCLQTPVSVVEEDTTKRQKDIVPNYTGKEVTLTALSMLEVGSIQANPDSVRDMSLLILQYRS
jgi:hypothetical protein